MVDTRTPPQIGGNFRKYLFVILPRSNSSFHEITRDDKVDKEKEEFFSCKDYIGSENNLDELCVRRKVRDILSPLIIYIFSFKRFFNFSMLVLRIFFYSFSLMCLIIRVNIRLVRDQTIDSWIGSD